MKMLPALPLLAAAALSASSLHAQTLSQDTPAAPFFSLNALLQKGLLEEEGNQNLEAAAHAYREVEQMFENERRLAATAIYRLAEIARKQDRRDEAVKLYQRLTTEFSTCEPMARMSRENLAALGAAAAPPAGGQAPAGPGVETEPAELTALRQTAKHSPDLINSMDEAGLCPIHRAARDGQLAAVVFLLENKVPVDTPAVTGRTALHYAAEAGHKAVAERLAAQGAKVDVVCNDYVAPKRKEQGTENGTTVWAMEGGRVLENATPLHLALMSRRTVMAEWLISKGANVNAVVKHAWLSGDGAQDRVRASSTPLSLAVGDPALVNLLLDKGADPRAMFNEQNEEVAKTLLHILAQGGDVAMIDTLLARGVSVDVPDSQGRPPLFYTQSAGTMRHLLEKGAAVPPDAVHRIVYPSSDLKVRRGMYELLATKGADIKALNSEGWSLLTAKGLETDDPDFVTWLLDQGVPAVTGQFTAKDTQYGKAKAVIYERVTLPELLRKPAITVVRDAGEQTWEAMARQGADDPQPTLPEVMHPWFNANLAPLTNGRLAWRYESGTVSESPCVDWTAVTLVRPGPDGKPVREKLTLKEAFGKEPPVIPWGTVVELATRESGSMDASVYYDMAAWNKRRVLITIGDTQREYTVPYSANGIEASEVDDLVRKLIANNPRINSVRVLRRREGDGIRESDFSENGAWPRIVSGDEIVVGELPKDSPTVENRIKGRILFHLPDQNRWLPASEGLIQSLQAVKTQMSLEDRDLRVIKVTRMADKKVETIDLEKLFEAWDGESQFDDVKLAEYRGSIVELPPTEKDGPPGISPKLEKLLKRPSLLRRQK